MGPTDRARIPFAMIGVLLLVSAITVGITLESRQSPTPENDVAVAVERTEAAAQSALRSAVLRAADRAAQQPLTRTGDTPLAQSLDGEDPFMAYFALLVRQELATSLPASGQRVHDVTTTLSLASVPPTAWADRIALRADEPDLEPGVVEAAVPNVTMTVQVDGTVVEERELTVQSAVASPIVDLHESVSTFEQRLEAGPLEPGFGRQLAARLYALAWARGYAQYAGAPIAEVVGNRHVEVMANDAIFATQRAVFGTADRHGPDAQRRAWLCLAARDAQELYDREPPAGVDAETVCEGLRYVYGDVDGTLPDPPTVQGLAGSAPGLNATDEYTVGHTADLAVRSLLTDDGDRSIARASDRVHRVRVSRAVSGDGTSFDGLDIETPERVRGDPNWTAAPPDRTTETVDVSVDQTTRDQYDVFDLSLTNEFRETRRWHDENGSTISRSDSSRETFGATLRISGEESPGATTPDRVERRYEPGPSNWHLGHDLLLTAPENFAPIPGDATEAIIDPAPVRTLERVLESGGPSVSSSAELTALLERRTDDGAMLRAPRPTGLVAWITSDLVSLRDTIANESITVDRASLVEPGPSPMRELIARIEDRRADLVTPATYETVPDRARHEARDAYLQAVIDDLKRVAEAHETATGALDDELEGANDGIGDVTALVRETLGATEPEPATPPSPSFTANYTVEVAGAPTYLTREPVTADQVSAVSTNDSFAPLATRTTNHFSIPYDAIVSGILSRIPLPWFDLEPDGAEVPLQTAGEALEAATEAHQLAPQRVSEPRELETAVAGAMRDLEGTVALIAASALPGVGHEALLEPIRTGLASSGDDVASRAVALGDGSASDRIAAEAARALADDRPSAYDGAPGTWPAMVESAVRPTVDRQVGETTVTVAESELNALDGAVRSAVNETANRVLEERLGGNASRLEDAWLNTSDGPSPNRVPAGLPVLPVPGYWAVTANVWDVDVSGEYARFEARSTAGPTDGPGGVTYVREDQPVSVTIDGTVHHLGWTDPVSFDGGTTIVVVVPPGGVGVGDRTGERTRCSPSFPITGPLESPSEGC